MKVIDNKEFINNLCPKGKTPEECGIMPLEQINKHIKDVMPPFKKRGTDASEYCILGIKYAQDVEGLVKIVMLDMIPPGVRNLARRRSHIIVSDILPRVTVPILVRMGGVDYMLLISQKRLTIGGKVTIEVYRGSIAQNTPNNKLALALMERKLPLLNDYFDLLQVRNLGYYWNNTGISGTRMPIQGLIYIAKDNIPVEEIKQKIVLHLDNELDPITGPPNPATKPVFKTLLEVKERISEAMMLPPEHKTDIQDADEIEAYLNDLFSVTAILLLFKSLEKEELPF